MSLLELRGNTFVADRFENLSVENGLLVAKNLSPGDYDLWLKEPVGTRTRSECGARAGSVKQTVSRSAAPEEMRINSY